MSGAAHIYLVTGAAGQYDEYRTWVVAAYTTRKQAVTHWAALMGRVRWLQSAVHTSGVKWSMGKLDPRGREFLVDDVQYSIDQVRLDQLARFGVEGRSAT